MKPNIDCLKNLSHDQLRQLRFFIENLGYRKAAERAAEEFNQPIHKTALQRFMRRSAPAEFLDDHPNHDDATAQILKFAADGQPNFTDGTIRALEQLAFQLAFTCTAMDEDMNALNKITTMLCRYRNAAVRERVAAVQEAKLKLRQERFEIENPFGSSLSGLREQIAEALDVPSFIPTRETKPPAEPHDPGPPNTDSPERAVSPLEPAQADHAPESASPPELHTSSPAEDAVPRSKSPRTSKARKFRTSHPPKPKRHPDPILNSPDIYSAPKLATNKQPGRKSKTNATPTACARSTACAPRAINT